MLIGKTRQFRFTGAIRTDESTHASALLLRQVLGVVVANGLGWILRQPPAPPMRDR